MVVATSPTQEAPPPAAIPAPVAVPEVERTEPAVARPERAVAGAEPAVERAEPAVARAERGVAPKEPDNVAAQPAAIGAGSPPAIETVSMSLPPDSDLVMVETRFAPVVETAASKGAPVIPLHAQRTPSIQRLNTAPPPRPAASTDIGARRPSPTPSGERVEQDLSDMEIPTFIRRQMD